MTSAPWGWRRFLLVLACGVFAALGQAPYDVPVALFAGFALALAFYPSALTARQAALCGWALGTGYFAHTLQWIVSPFMVDVARHGWMAPFALVFLSAGLALFWGVAFGVARWLSPARSWPLILTWPAAELLRAYIFTGFPWAMPAQSLVSTLPGQGLAHVGPYALNAALIGAALVVFGFSGSWLRRLGRIAAATVVAMLLLLPPILPEAPMTGHTLRLVQPNAAQRDKWDPAKIPVFFDRQLSYSNAPPQSGQPAPDLIIWSETAIPWQLEHAEPALEQIAIAAGGVPVALGVQRQNAGNYYNSLVVVDPQRDVQQTYDKHHLVPFGEYMPLAEVMRRWGIFGLAARIPGGYTPGPGPELLDFGPLGTALPLICYEAVFPHDVHAAPKRPDFMVQITNDAWFGKGAGPRQHLAQARMRAIEQGLPLARAANTGISAMIDPWGRITGALPLNTAGFLDVAVPAPRAPTPYSRTGDLPFALLLLFGFALALLIRRRV